MFKLAMQLSPASRELRRRFDVAATIASSFLGRDVKEDLIGFASEAIRSRVRKNHEDAEGRRLRPYSPRYAAKKGVSPGAVDLTDGGDLLDSITGDEDDGDLIIFPAGDHPRANLSNEDLMLIHHGGATIKNGFGRGIRFSIPARPVWGLTKQEEALIAGVAFELMEKFLVPDLEDALDGRIG